MTTQLCLKGWHLNYLEKSIDLKNPNELPCQTEKQNHQETIKPTLPHKSIDLNLTNEKTYRKKKHTEAMKPKLPPNPLT